MESGPHRTVIKATASLLRPQELGRSPVPEAGKLCWTLAGGSLGSLHRCFKHTAPATQQLHFWETTWLQGSQARTGRRAPAGVHEDCA